MCKYYKKKNKKKMVLILLRLLSYMRYILIIIKVLNITQNWFINGGYILENFLDPDPDAQPESITNNDKKEIKRNILFVKLIISMSLIAMFKMNTEQISYVIVSNVLSELIELLVFYKKDLEDDN